jgi:hypothetical protein
MQNDIVEKIAFVRNDKSAIDSLHISYLQDISRTSDEFGMSKVRTSLSLSKTPPGIQWLFHLADGTLVK